VAHEGLFPLAFQRGASMICASRPVPSVVTTRACVSPRVNTAEPCVRGRTPTCTSILRTVFVSRPSMRGLPAMMRPRTTLYSVSWNAASICAGVQVLPSRAVSSATHCFLSSLILP
jgi:hypothetical protein